MKDDEHVYALMPFATYEPLYSEDEEDIDDYFSKLVVVYHKYITLCVELLPCNVDIITYDEFNNITNNRE